MTNTRKVVVISGGMGGVGRAAAAAFAREQYRTVVLYRHSSEEDLATVKALLPDEPIFIQCDIRDAQETARTIDTVLSSTGRIDVAVHTAVGPIMRKKLLMMDAAGFRSQFETGFFGAFNLFRPIAAIMKQQKSGTLIGITSSAIESSSTAARMGAYTVGKIALRGLLRELHRELSPAGIRVLAIAPDLMHTRLNADLPEKFFETVVGHAGGRALMTPEEVAGAIAALCADAAIPSGMSYLVSSGTMAPL
ncbi:MAG: 3-oxoacyl-[acyl-carrier protein] reductase [Parcubacteria group bacterium GW2011_GWA2_56_21]|nr:MAG: 3-oxoacyl-[acyl-carrier protein] reductase [Parcubacteria group bacterium GW2011_GWA2_56_21]